MQEERKILMPALDRIILKKRQLVEEQKSGTLILPSSAPKQDRYEVWKMHPKQDDVCYTWLEVQEGDTCYIDKYKGVEVEFEGEKYLIVSTQDIIAFEGWPK